MKKLFLLPAILCSVLTLQAQVSQLDLSSFSKQDELKTLTSSKMMRNVTSFDNRYEGVKGTPFIYDDWSEGSLILSDSAIVKSNMLYKFDGINNELWVKLKNGPERILYSRELLSFELHDATGKSVKFRKVKLPESTDRHHFAISIYEGKNISLIRDFKKVFKKSNLQDKGLITTGNAYDWFEEENTFYVKKGNKEYSKVNFKKNDVIEALKLSRPATESVEKFCKSNDIKGKLTEEQALKMLTYVETLLEN